jgi:hypothetical protein
VALSPNSSQERLGLIMQELKAIRMMCFPVLLRAYVEETIYPDFDSMSLPLMCPECQDWLLLMPEVLFEKHVIQQTPGEVRHEPHI